MRSLAGYQLISQLYDSVNSEVYRAIRESDHLPVILKILKQDYPSSVELTRYRQEYELLSTLNIDSIVKVYGLEKHRNTLAIILEDFGGDSLRTWMKTCQFSIAECLAIAIKITTSFLRNSEVFFFKFSFILQFPSSQELWEL